MSEACRNVLIDDRPIGAVSLRLDPEQAGVAALEECLIRYRPRWSLRPATAQDRVDRVLEAIGCALTGRRSTHLEAEILRRYLQRHGQARLDEIAGVREPRRAER